MLAAIRVVKKIIKPILFIIGIALIIAFAIAWIAAVISLFFGQPFLFAVFPDQMALANLGIFSVFLIVGLPLLGIILLISRLLFNTKASPTLTYSAIGLSVLGWIGFFTAASILAQNFSANKQVEISKTELKSDILEIAPDRSLANLQTGRFMLKGEEAELFINQGEWIAKNIELIFKKTQESDISISQKVYTRGKDTNEAENLAKNLSYSANLTGNKLTIPTHFKLAEGEKFRGQKVIIEVRVPEGKSLRLDEDLLNFLPHTFKTVNKARYIEDCFNLKMGENGFYCPEKKSRKPINENIRETI